MTSAARQNYCDIATLTLLPQVRTEDLDQTDLQGRDFTMPVKRSDMIAKEEGPDIHEDTSQIELHLETDVDVCAIDRRAPPERESTVRDLVKTGPLRVRELLVPHRLLEAGRLLPEQTLPGREVRALEERMLKDTLDTSKSSDDVDTVIVELPQLAVVALGSPPERIASRY